MMLILLTLSCGVPPSPDPSPVDSAIARLLKPSPDSAVNRAACDRLIAIGPDALLPVLRAWPSDDPVAGHWLRTVADDIATQHASKLPVDALLAFASDSKFLGKARRIALAAVERKSPGTIAKLLPTFLNDPEFGADAVADRISVAESATDPAESKRILLTAYAAATDVDQTQRIAKKLTATGEAVTPLVKLGVISRWNAIGLPVQDRSRTHLLSTH